MTITIPNGNILTPKGLGQTVREQRKHQGITQVELAALCGVGVRFISDFESGKATIEMGKALQVLAGLGLKLTIEARGWNRITQVDKQSGSPS